MNNQDYSKYYNVSSFWKKMKEQVGNTNQDLLENVLTLYYVLIDNDTSIYVKGTILFALGYFIFPFDAIPDFTPFIGYVDDVAVILATIINIQKSITPEHKKKASETAKTI